MIKYYTVAHLKTALTHPHYTTFHTCACPPSLSSQKMICYQLSHSHSHKSQQVIHRMTAICPAFVADD